MADARRSRYLCAFSMINNGGTLGQQVDIHQQLRHTPNSRLYRP
jgi:hypothetical protein